MSTETMSKSVRDLIEKKKLEDESGARTSSGPVKPVDQLDLKAIPALKNTISYEDIVGCEHPDGVERLYPAPPTKWKNADDIPKPNPNWVADHDTLPLTIAALCFGHNALMIGETGTGKTTDVREVCARIKMPYYRVNGAEGLEFANCAGEVKLLDGETKFIDGPIMPAVRHGGCLTIDEPFKMQPGELMGFQWLAESREAGRAVMLYGHEDADEVKVSAHPEFRMFLCDNVRGTGDNMDVYAATNVQDASFVNRMQYKIRKTYMDNETEAAAIQIAYPWIMDALAAQMVQFAGLMRKAWAQGSIEMPFSFRELETWAQIIAENRGLVRQSLDACFGNMLESGDEQEIYHKALKDVGV